MNKTKLNGKPRWIHTCQNCTFLGHTVVEGKHFDMYECKGRFPTFLAKFGKADESYLSFPSAEMIAEIVVEAVPTKK
jgi:hypothetical protein